MDGCRAPTVHRDVTQAGQGSLFGACRLLRLFNYQPCPLALSTLSKVFISFVHQRCNLSCFLDLIRHGKHHNHNVTNQHPKQVETSPPPSMTPVSPHPVVSPGPREAAQIIVDEERQAHSKMPRYQGLDNFELIDKMGELVDINPSFVLFFSPGSSGAFSNVYKGIDRRTSMKVAGIL